KNAVWLIVALGVTKIIHEFGHGLTCKHFGGECHEMGVMFLVFTPCLYCNVSDSWMLPNKWHRIYISLGGIFIELCIASAAVFVWWFSQPGFLNYLALSTVFVCSVSTIMFNGNPLLRYDGYYVAADLLEIPNLWQKSRSVLTRALGVHCLGLKYPPDPFLPEKNHFVFGAYAVASSIYRWVVMFSILWFLHKVFEPYRLQVLGQVLALMSIFGLIVAPIYQMITFFWVPGRVSQVKPVRLVVSLAIAVSVLALIAFCPLPRRVFAPFIVEPAGARSVYVTMPGELRETRVKIGDVVKQGDLLGVLSNVEVDLDVEDIEGQTSQQRVLVETMERRRRTDPQINAEIPQARESLLDLEARLEQRKEERARLMLTAPIAGTILPGDRMKPRPQRSAELGEWAGDPLDPCNLGAFFKKGVVFCRVGDPQKMEASIVVDQGDVEFITLGQPIELLLEELPGEPIQGVVAEISDDPIEYAPEALSEKAGGQLQTAPDPRSGQQRPLNISYRVRMALDKYDPRISLGSRGEAKIFCGYTTLWNVVYRYFSATFNFQ
ncbi:MAG TPA: site-2 protease family protein, partial [Pirellulales bacterium]